MRAHAQRLDLAFRFQLLGIFDDVAFKYTLIVLFAVHKMDHPDIHIIGLQPGQKIFKKGFAVRQIPRALILPV